MDPITLGLAAGSTIGNIAGQVVTNKKSRDFAKEQADIAWDRQLDLYNRMKEDNSPSNARSTTDMEG